MTLSNEYFIDNYHNMEKYRQFPADYVHVQK